MMTHIRRKTHVTSKILGAAAVVALVAAMSVAASAEAAGTSVCGPRKQIQKFLVDRYQESSRGLGLVSDQGIVELYISKTGTWSIVMTMAAGSTYIIAAGHTWQELAAELDGPAA